MSAEGESVGEAGNAASPTGAGPVSGVTAPRATRDYDIGTGKRPTLLIALIVAFLVLGMVAILLTPKAARPVEAELVATIADLSPVHAGVTAAGETVRELRRLADGDVIETDADGRARLRLDTGATVVLDGSTKLSVTMGGVRVERGRVFLQGSAAPTTLDLGEGASVRMVGGAAGVERRDKTKVYVANGELVARAGEKESTVRVGETVTFEGGAAAVGPERGYDDWTGGLAAPWGATGVPRRAVGELWGRSRAGDAGSPLTIRKHEVDATIRGELAETRVRTTFFNAGQAAVTGDFRIALPPSAIVSGFAVVRGDARREGHIALAKRGEERGQLDGGQSDVLEWAGEGWARGSIPQIAPGLTVSVEISYTEWLPVVPKPKSHVVQYRYPLAGEGEALPIGELFVRVDAGPAGATRLAAGMGARSDGSVVELRKSDFVASADFVVDAEIPAELPRARAYVALGANEDDDSTVLIRTEAPRLDGVESGVTLAIVLDASSSMDPALFAASRAFVESLVRGLGPKDRAVVLASDTAASPVGPSAVGPVDAARKAEILAALGTVTLGGATDLGRALEAGADALPADAPSGMVVYVGDGFPSVGDRTAEAMRARLARRPRGVPRLGAVLVGPESNRGALAALVSGSGPVLEIGDSESAAEAAVGLLERALVPTVTGVELDLGPGVIRAYPRGDIAATQGSTVTVVGKLAGAVPRDVTFVYRSGTEKRGEIVPLTVRQAATTADVHRRWADARARSMALAGRGREAVTEAALKAGLLTPWTAWTTEASAEYVPTFLSQRVLDLTLHGYAGLSAAIQSVRAPNGTMASDAEALFGTQEDSLDAAVTQSSIETLEGAMGQLRACRDARAALRPDLPGALEVVFEVDGDGHAKGVTVNGAGDEPLARCVTTVVESLSYPRAGETLTAKVRHTLVWPPPPALRGKKCSPTSSLPVAQRRGVWVERIRTSGALPTFAEARATCELATWTAKRTLLELAISGQRGLWILDLADGVEREGDLEAAALLRKEALARATVAEMRLVRLRLMRREILPRAKLDERYAKAADDKERLAVVRSFLVFAPHSSLLRARLVALLAALGEKEALADEVRRLRVDPLADAPLLADAAHALRLVGLDAESRRTFGEIAERATNDPWSLALLGDRLRNEGFYEDAAAAYTSLLDLVPGDGSSELRMALADAGAGRVDLALRSLGRVARTGGRTGESDLATLAERSAFFLAHTARSKEGLSEAERAALAHTTAELPPLPPGQVFFVTWAAGDRNTPGVSIERGKRKPAGAEKAAALQASPAEAVAARIGLASLVAAPGGAPEVTLVFSRQRAVPPGEAAGKAQVVTLVNDKLVMTEVDLPRLPEEPVTLAWTGTGFEPAK
ncbi:MAG: VWA domain-containing protein [Myxococcales bacterium]|nr:VWA domain-containing protein [Myxococcales bacterium]